MTLVAACRFRDGAVILADFTCDLAQRRSRLIGRGHSPKGSVYRPKFGVGLRWQC